MISHGTTLNKDCFLRGTAEVAIDIRKFDSMSGKRCGELLGDTSVFVGFEMAFSAGKVIHFGDTVCK